MKIIARTFLLVTLLFFLHINIYSQEKASGTIFFIDGTSQAFTDFESIIEGPFKNASELSNHRDGLLVSYQNSFRTIPFGNLKKIILIPERIYNWVNIEGELDVTTKNGINFITPITISAFRVYIKDDLSNSVILQPYYFAKAGKQVTSKIEFD